MATWKCCIHVIPFRFSSTISLYGSSKITTDTTDSVPNKIPNIKPQLNPNTNLMQLNTNPQISQISSYTKLIYINTNKYALKGPRRHLAPSFWSFLGFAQTQAGTG